MDDLETVPWFESLTYTHGMNEPSYIDNILRESAYITECRELRNIEDRELYLAFQFSETLDATSQVYESVAKEVRKSNLWMKIVAQRENSVVVELQDTDHIFDAYEYSEQET